MQTIKQSNNQIINLEQLPLPTHPGAGIWGESQGNPSGPEENSDFSPQGRSRGHGGVKERKFQ